MSSSEPKKLALIRILQILQRKSDENHPLTQAKLLHYLKSDYDIEIERKAVGRNLSLLKEADYDIVQVREGSYLGERDFTDAELRILIDGVLSSSHIGKKYTKDLIDKLCGLSGEYFRSQVKHIYTVDSWEKTENKEIFYNIELVDDAIEKGVQITFDYNKYGLDRKLHKTKNHTVSPYQMILHNQRYYLMARSERWENLGYFRMDRITNMQLTEEKANPITSIEGYENGIDYNEFSTKLPYMYADKPERVEFTADVSIIDQVIDWFGRDIRIKKIPDDENTVSVSVMVSPLAMEHWALQYATHTRVTSPAYLAEKIHTDLTEAAEKYGD